MAATANDPLLLLRQTIAASGQIVPTTSAEFSADEGEATLSEATHLQFSAPAQLAIPIDTQTRFVTNDKAVDLRSVYCAWLNREVAIPEYNASVAKLNDELAKDTTPVHQFAFVERLELISWLEGASEESDYIKAPGDKDGSAAALAATFKDAPVSSTRAGRGTLDPRLAEIYRGERRMGDRNSVLHGIKPTDFSHVRKLALSLLGKREKVPNGTNIGSNPSLALNQKPVRRPDPIILLSPSASSLLRLSNVQNFLGAGRYVPPDSGLAEDMLHVSRVLKDIDPARPMRFILVESTEKFKPDYWNRVVAVFTTGQAWQFKSYKWSNPDELFKHVLGVYLGWRDDQPPESVRGFGHRVQAYGIEKWRESDTSRGADGARFRDREVMESIWKAIEANMRSKGWRKDAAPTSI
ncbi:CDC73-domain-containing protein [Thozetella sp. PMI_491]|nr:CDC73-domain-containing protein [Thozetella sp. PMI_491]